MEFRVLGPVEVIGDGAAPIAVPGRIRPRILAALLLAQGRAVSTGGLVDVVWDGDAPATAEHQLRNAMPGLRKVVGDRIERIGGGYRLRLDDDELDLVRFQRFVATARAARHRGDDREALTRLRSALRLWRGTAASGLSGRYFTAVANRLAEERLGALEDRIDLELVLGDSTGLTAELQGLTSEHPHRQRLTAQLVLALHCDGRTPAALEVYQRTRSRLIEVQGVRPGRELTELHSAILRGDPKLRPHRRPAIVARPVVGRLPVPAQLPADTASFTGRHAPLAALDELVTREAATVVIAGPGGAGKTALALHWAHRHREKYRDGQLYLNLRGFDHAAPVSAYAALERILTALGLSGSAIPADLDAAATLFRSMVADRRMLLVLDNARDAEQVRPLLSGGTGGFTIVTSRDSLAGLAAVDGAALLNLPVLDLPAALELLGELLGDRRLTAKPAAAEQLARLCGGLPLVLRIAAANLAARPQVSVADYVSELESENRLDLLAVSGDPSAAVATSFEHSYRALDSSARRVFLRLGSLPGEDFSDDLAAEVTGLPVTGAREELNRLRTAHLLEQHRPGRHRFHDLIRLYAAQRARRTLTETSRSQLVDRYIAWHHSRALTLPLTDTVNIVAAISTLREHPRVWQLALTLQAVIYAGQVPNQTRQLIVDSLRQAERQHDRAARCQMTSLLGAWHTSVGQVETALSHCREAMSLARGADLFANGIARGNLGAALMQYGGLREAETLWMEAWDIAEQLGTVVWKQATDFYLAQLYGVMGEYDKAFGYLDEADALTRCLPTTSAVVINGLARARLLVDTGRIDAAERELATVDAEVDDSDDNRAHCMYLSVLGDVSLARGDAVAARAAFDRMRTVAGRHGMACVESEARCRLAVVLSDLGEHDAARDCLEPVLHEDIAQQGPRVAAEVAFAAAVVDNGTRNFASAVAHGRRAADVFGDMPSPRQHRRSLMVVAEAHTGLGEHDAARRCAAAAEAIRPRVEPPTR